jgi:2-iminobutanoate/2-iminopropanoate deaminase
MKKPVVSDTAPQAIGPYSQAIDAGGMVFVSGQIPLDAGGKLVTGSISEQTERVIKNLAVILAAADLSLASVVKTTVYMTDLGQFAAMNEVYARHFQEPFPARATVQVGALPKGVAVEIDAVAVRA